MNPKEVKRKIRFPGEKWYDAEYDSALISQSIAKQYGILPTAQEELSYSEWALLVSGLMEDTPLGQIVLIRKENDPERLKRFSPYQIRIRNEWRSFIAKEKLERSGDPEKMIAMFEKAFSKMFG